MRPTFVRLARCINQPEECTPDTPFTLIAQIQLGLSTRLGDGADPFFRFRTQAVASVNRHPGVRQRVDNRIPGEPGR